MLSNSSPDNTMAADSTTAKSISPAEMQSSPVVNEDQQDAVQHFLDVLASPEFRDAASFDMDTYLTSPLLGTPYDTPYDDFATSPADDSPFNDFLTTPVMQDISDPVMNDSLEFENMSLFPDMGIYEDLVKAAPEMTTAVPKINEEQMYTISPGTPALHSVDPSSLYPSPRMPQSLPPNNNRRKSSATGTRKNITPESLVPIDAPTQPRKYQYPSATSRKEVPAGFAKKRSRSQAFGDEEDELDEPPLGANATEKEQIEWKRRQNTLAARKSRKRKLEYQQNLENTIAHLTKENQMYKTQAEIMRHLLQSHGIALPPFEE